MRSVVARTARVRDSFAARLLSAGYVLPESYTNFVLVPFASTAEAQAADVDLRRAGFLLRGMGGYGLGHCLRATVGAEDFMNDVAEILVTLKTTRARP
jgi:histidinol-phosphate aminotransferase/N-methylhydantoinase B